MDDKKIKITKLLGFLFQGLLGNFLFGVFFFWLGIVFGGPQIYIERSSAIFASILLLVIFLIVIGWSAAALTKSGISERLTISGPYHLVRNPIYSAIIFLLNPAVAIYLRSWLLFLAIIPVYFVWKKCASKKEKILAEKFESDYWHYEITAWRFLPNLWRFNKLLFYSAAALSIFAVTFITLNFPSVYLRWVTYQPKEQKIVFADTLQQQPSPEYFQNTFLANSGAVLPEQPDATPAPRADYNADTNSILISKINVNAPLIFPDGTTQKELNQALDQGVIIYPGSALPGQRGEVFLSGHSSSYPWDKTQYGQVFTLLDKLDIGDTISLVFNNTQYDYRVSGKQVLAPADTKVTQTNEPTLTLMTCWPVGTALNRLVVRADLIQ